MSEHNKNERPFYIFVDVNGTFVRSAGTKRDPMPAVLQQIRELKEQGGILYCWSSGGAEYASKVRKSLALMIVL